MGLLENPVLRVRLPRLHNARDRRVNKGELERLERALGSCRNQSHRPVIMFAIETAMRRGEIIALSGFT
mgnify:CR=1 FL=1